MTQKV